jgi:transketolase
MSEITPRNARTWSRMGTRAVYGLAVSEFAKDNPDILALSADLGRSSGLDRFSKEFPEQFLNTGIAEQNMVGVAAGFARMGFRVFASTFAPFASMRASEQVRMNMGYMQEPVNLVALGSGLAMGFLGNSHYGLEDISVMRAIPNLTIISPSDCAEIFKTIEAVIGFDGPTYIRLTGAINNPIVNSEEYDFEIGKAIWVKDPVDINIIAVGSMVGQALKAAELLEGEGIDVGVLNCHTIKPLDNVTVKETLANSSFVFVIEEHTVIGGLGGAVCGLFAEERYSCDLTLHGIKDKFVSTGDYDYLLKINGLDGVSIQNLIKEKLKK